MIRHYLDIRVSVDMLYLGVLRNYSIFVAVIIWICVKGIHNVNNIVKYFT